MLSNLNLVFLERLHRYIAISCWLILHGARNGSAPVTADAVAPSIAMFKTTRPTIEGALWQAAPYRDKFVFRSSYRMHLPERIAGCTRGFSGAWLSLNL